ncbi:hypothetical protein F7725_022511 [Dissostichus mawsoni]|uniref:Uncharacterized protein n=1 Tax=Dissostichus mawsoni TaxID=36200 RepID=A0A7J5YYH0_DISMA|nr:hypothetical protein F7725_022511 [Dissostichus mawsoni]
MLTSDEKVSMLFQSLTVLSHHVIQPEVQLVKGERLLRVGGSFPVGSLSASWKKENNTQDQEELGKKCKNEAIVTLSIQTMRVVVHLQAGKHGVFKADVDSHYVVHQCVGFVGFQWRGNGRRNPTPPPPPACSLRRAVPENSPRCSSCIGHCPTAHYYSASRPIGFWKRGFLQNRNPDFRPEYHNLPLHITTSTNFAFPWRCFIPG